MIEQFYRRSIEEIAFVAMTTLVYRGVPYYKEEAAEEFTSWWQWVHRPALWLKYRGQKYRPCQIDKSGWK